mmetsp:Transcript_84822/g.186224  ORF Transcript_84822/g.186224 Transcript_84822/m.186224 type:complete len:211 (-) Transcript_84822:1378-2010(-)
MSPVELGRSFQLGLEHCPCALSFRQSVFIYGTAHEFQTLLELLGRKAQVQSDSLWQVQSQARGKMKCPNDGHAKHLSTIEGSNFALASNVFIELLVPMCNQGRIWVEANELGHGSRKALSATMFRSSQQQGHEGFQCSDLGGNFRGFLCALCDHVPLSPGTEHQQNKPRITPAEICEFVSGAMVHLPQAGAHYLRLHPAIFLEEVDQLFW